VLIASRPLGLFAGFAGNRMQHRVRGPGLDQWEEVLSAFHSFRCASEHGVGMTGARALTMGLLCGMAVTYDRYKDDG
jgi:hypothetical protein